MVSAAATEGEDLKQLPLVVIGETLKHAKHLVLPCCLDISERQHSRGMETASVPLFRRVFFCQLLRQIMRSSGGQVEQSEGPAIGSAEEVVVHGFHPPALRSMDLLEKAPREVHDVAKGVRRHVADDDERLRVMGRVGGDEVPVVEEAVPPPTDSAAAAEVLGRDTQQNFIQRVGSPGQAAPVL